jgi:hypothetical protein
MNKNKQITRIIAVSALTLLAASAAQAGNRFSFNNFWGPHKAHNNPTPHFIQTVKVPEPGTLGLVAAGVAGVAWLRRKSR